MIHKKIAACLFLTVLLFSFSNLLAANANGRLLFDFTSGSEATKWYAVNDGVMGGRSIGKFRITDSGNLEFYGAISLENNGGFASIRTDSRDLQLTKDSNISLRVRGDGRTYALNLRKPSMWSASAYRAEFNTKDGVWQNITIPLQAFEYTSFGRKTWHTNAAMSPSEITGLGIILADKKSGPFKLEIAWIKVEDNRAGKNSSANDIVDTAIRAGKFNTLVAAVKAAGLVETLKGKGPFTVFAPTDEAFAKLPQGTLSELLKPSNKSKLTEILTFHVVSGRVRLDEKKETSLQGSALNIKATGNYKVNDSIIIAPNIETSNGIIHIIDTVLLPETENADPGKPARSARDVISLAIQRGVPLFNKGQAAACAAIYEVTVETLISSYSNVIKKSEISMLKEALRKMKSLGNNPSEQAWILRRALDKTYLSLDR